MEGVYINIHFKNYIQHEFELLFDNDNSNWWGRGDKNFWSRRLVLRGTASLEMILISKYIMLLNTTVKI